MKFNMGTALLKIKIMPNSPTTDLKKIEKKAQEIVLKSEGRHFSVEIEPIAFGLNAMIVSFAIDESKSIEDIENKFRGINDVSSVDVIDFRRAFG